MTLQNKVCIQPLEEFIWKIVLQVNTWLHKYATILYTKTAVNEMSYKEVISMISTLLFKMMEYFWFSSGEDFKVVYLATKWHYGPKFVRNDSLHLQITLYIFGLTEP